MKKNLLLFITILMTAFSCSNFDVQTLNDNINVTYNKVMQDLESMNELMSLETISNTKVKEDITNYAKEINDNILVANKALKAYDLPSSLHAYRDSTMNLFTSINNVAQFNLKFLEFDDNTPNYIVEGFGAEHDKINMKLIKQISNFEALRNEILEANLSTKK